VALAASFLAAGGKIYLKAQRAKLLLRRRWAETQGPGHVDGSAAPGTPGNDSFPSAS
jgi:hypothetical protein